MIQNTKYIFFGSPRFAEIVLEKLINAKLAPLAVVVNPDKPVGRKKVLTPPPVKVLAEKNSVKVFQPEKIDSDFIEEMKKLQPELFVVGAYSKIIPADLIAVLSHGALGIHPSLLPKYRGASPIQGAILGGESTTGVTLYKMDEKVDHGPIYAQKEANIGINDGYLELEERLATLGGEMAVAAFPKIISGELLAKEQDHAEATFTKKFKTEDGFVSDEILKMALSGENPEGAENVNKIIRALNPDPGVYTIKEGKRIKLLESEVLEGILIIKRIQLEGKTPTSITGVIGSLFR